MDGLSYSHITLSTNIASLHREASPFLRFAPLLPATRPKLASRQSWIMRQESHAFLFKLYTGKHTVITFMLPPSINTKNVKRKKVCNQQQEAKRKRKMQRNPRINTCRIHRDMVQGMPKIPLSIRNYLNLHAEHPVQALQPPMPKLLRHASSGRHARPVSSGSFIKRNTSAP